MEKFRKLYEVVSDNGRVFQFDGKVHVGNKGNIFVEERTYSTKTMPGGFKKQRQTLGGYWQVSLTDKNGEKGYFYVHRLVGFAWLNKKDFQHDVLHKDDNPSNNSVKNLFWGTHLDNMRDKAKKGRARRGEKTDVSIIIDIYTRRRKGESPSSIHSDYPEISKGTFQHYCSGRALRLRKVI